jgi:penicillin amidase
MPRPKERTEVLIAEGLDEPVEVRWDDDGTPHVLARSAGDALFAQGYLHGRDRAFQMDMARRLPAGRLAELLGPPALPMDRFMRRLNAVRWAREAPSTWSPETAQLADRYVAGVNAAFLREPLPAEYRILRRPLEPWSVQDSNLLVYYLAWALNTIWTAKWGYARVADDPVAREWLFGPLEHRPGITIIPGTGAPLAGGSIGVGSNNWVVSGALTANGHPLLANDPHLMPTLPSVWYTITLDGGDLSVAGASLPGGPGVVIGQNRDIAWGMTNVDPDVQDLYWIEPNPDGASYRLDDESRPFAVRREVIAIGGRRTETLVCYDTHVGPVIVDNPDGSRVAMAWSAFQPLPTLEALLRLNRARGWDEFLAALAYWWAPAQNFVYADREGHIGYVCAGRVPRRSAVPSLGCLDGNTTATAWAGWVPWEEMPRCLDPADGFIVTANNAVVGDQGGPLASGRYSLGYRAARIAARLRADGPHTPETFRRIQADVVSEPLLDLTRRLLDDPGLPESWRQVLDRFDGAVTVESAAPTLLYLFCLGALPAGVKTVLDRPFFPGVVPDVPGRHPFPERLWALLGERLVPSVLQHWTDVDVPAARSWAEETGRRLWGPDLAFWRWGRAHVVDPFHPLAQVPGLGRVFGRGPLPSPGDLYTPHQAAFAVDPNLPWPRPVAYHPSYRQICDPAEPERMLAVHFVGQSGNPLSPFYDNLLEPYREARLLPLRGEELSAGGLRFVPTGAD